MNKEALLIERCQEKIRHRLSFFIGQSVDVDLVTQVIDGCMSELMAELDAIDHISSHLGPAEERLPISLIRAGRERFNRVRNLAEFELKAVQKTLRLMKGLQKCRFCGRRYAFLHSSKASSTFEGTETDVVVACFKCGTYLPGPSMKFHGAQHDYQVGGSLSVNEDILVKDFTVGEMWVISKEFGLLRGSKPACGFCGNVTGPLVFAEKRDEDVEVRLVLACRKCRTFVPLTSRRGNDFTGIKRGVGDG